MKLYLSSIGIPDDEAFLSLFPKDAPRNIAIITTAWGVDSPEKSKPFIEAATKQLTDLGFSHEYVDFANFEGKKDDLQAKLRQFSALWVLGGNTFYLNYWMHKSSFDVIIKGLLSDGMIYGGESAGAVVMGKTLHGIELLDNPNDAPDVIWEGLGLVDFGIIPHWGRSKYADRHDQSYDEMQQFCRVKTLKDDDFITIK